jgi:hypothetical protein
MAHVLPQMTRRRSNCACPYGGQRAGYRVVSHPHLKPSWNLHCCEGCSESCILAEAIIHRSYDDPRP